MSIKATVKRAIVNTSVYFTLITALYTLLVMVVNVTEDEILLSATQILFNFIFSVLAAAGWELFRLRSLPTALRVIIHYAVLLFAFYVCFLLPAEMRGSQIFIGIVALTVLYAAIMGIGTLIRSRFKANFEQASDYVKQYDRHR